MYWNCIAWEWRVQLYVWCRCWTTYIIVNREWNTMVTIQCFGFQKLDLVGYSQIFRQERNKTYRCCIVVFPCFYLLLLRGFIASTLICGTRMLSSIFVLSVLAVGSLDSASAVSYLTTVRYAISNSTPLSRRHFSRKYIYDRKQEIDWLS